MTVGGVYQAAAGDVRFVWGFDAPFDDAASGTWSAADFAGLQVGGIAPSAIDEVIGGDASLTLIYPLPDPDEAGLVYEVIEPPTVLVFAGGAALASPQAGMVAPA